MTTLAADQPRDYYQGDFESYPVIASDIIYQGAAVGDNASGYMRPLTAGDPFKGFAETKVDNSTGAAGDKNVRVKTRGFIKLAISSLAITDEGAAVYASDDATFTLTAGSNTRIGHVHKWISTGYGVIEFYAVSGTEALLTDSSGGTASDTLAAITGTYVEATIENTVASLAAKINYLLMKQGN